MANFGINAKLVIDADGKSVSTKLAERVKSINGVPPDVAGNVDIVGAGGGAPINDVSTTSTTSTWSANKINTSLGTKSDTTHTHTGVYEPVITKNTGFNKNLGTTSGTVSEGNHTHTGTYEPVFAKNTGFNKNLGTTAGTVSEGNHTHSELHTHSNKTTLDKFGESAGSPTFNGSVIGGGSGGGATTLDGLTDVDTSTTPPTDGQVLKYVSSSGVWKPSADNAGSGGATLVATYTVSGNPVIQPTAIDLTTGYITCASHGLTTGDKIYLSRNGAATVIPFELFSASIISINTLQAVVIDANTFQVRVQTGTPLTYTNTSNTLVDATKFWFEKNCPNDITISGLNATNLLIEFFGKICNSSYTEYFRLFNGATEILNVEGGTNTSYQTIFDGNWTADSVNVNGTIKIKDNAMIVDTFKNYHAKAQADYDYIKNNPTLSYSRFTTPNTKTINMLPTSRTITSIKIVDQGNGFATYLNGFTIKVYDLGS